MHQSSSGVEAEPVSTMNIFRLAGDMTHLLSFLVLLLKIQATKNCRGASPTGKILQVNLFGSCGIYCIGVPA